MAPVPLQTSNQEPGSAATPAPSTATPTGASTPQGEVLAAAIAKAAAVHETLPPNSVYRNPGLKTFPLEDHPIDQGRSLKVAVIGAGLSGITAGVLLPAKVPGVDLTIFEKNADVGGTWFENRFPGCRCDIPANIYQATFWPNTQWSEEFAQGAEILDYWQRLARHFDVYKYCRFNRKIEGAEWDSETAKWKLGIRNLESGEEEKGEFDYLITAIGHFNAWKMPEYPGMDEYEGLLRHSSNWDPSFDPDGKNVAVIGNGASGIQIVPELQPIVNRLDHYARNPTWIGGSLGGVTRVSGRMLFSAEQLEELKDPKKYLQYRKALEETYWRKFAGVFKGSAGSSNAREDFTKLMSARLAENPALIKEVLPDFSPSCRRLTPGPGYLEALAKPNVSYIKTPIKRFTKTGIETTDGTHRDVDAVICSTGANVDFVPQFSIRANGLDLKEAWSTNGKWGFPYNYLGIAVPNFPNLGIVYGPNSIAVSGTTNNNVENCITYIAKVLRKLTAQGIRSMMPSDKATQDFLAYCDSFFPHTVMSENCSSWYNGGIPGGRIHGMWPGSNAHLNFARREPRWEDYDFEYTNQSENRFAWLGNGWTSKELDASSDLTNYLRLPEDVDLATYLEEWNGVY